MQTCVNGVCTGTGSCTGQPCSDTCHNGSCPSGQQCKEANGHWRCKPTGGSGDCDCTDATKCTKADECPCGSPSKGWDCNTNCVCQSGKQCKPAGDPDEGQCYINCYNNGHTCGSHGECCSQNCKNGHCEKADDENKQCCPGHSDAASCTDTKWCEGKGFGESTLENGQCCCSNPSTTLTTAICKGDDDPGPDPDPSEIDIPCMACSSKGGCPQGYECVTMSNGQKCCQPGMWEYDYKRGDYVFNPSDIGAPVGLENIGQGQANLDDLFDRYFGAGNLQNNNEWKTLLNDLERESGKDVDLMNVDQRTKDMQQRLTQNIQGMGGMPALSLMQQGGNLTGMENATQQAILGLLGQPKGYSPQEEELVLQRMRERIGSEYEQAAEGQKAQLGERGLLESGLGAYETGVARRGAAEQMGEAARDVAISNLEKKWEQQTSATGLAKDFTKQQQDFFQAQQEIDLRRQLEERGWSKDQIDRQIAELEMQNSFMTKQQQLDLEAQIASQEQKYKGFSLRQAVLGDEADWVMANRTLDIERAKHHDQAILDKNEFKLKRDLAIEQLKQDAAKFGLSVQELEATINTKRMEISQQSTALLLQYIAAILAAAQG